MDCQRSFDGAGALLKVWVRMFDWVMTKLVVFIGFCVAFAAGMTVRLSVDRQVQASIPTTMPTSRPSHRGGGILPAELNLTQDQQEKLSKIWSETAHNSRSEQEDRRRQLRAKRDEAIASLIQPADKEKYEQAQKDFTDQATALDKEMRDRFKNAVEETKALLTPEQRTKYEEFLSRHPLGGPGGPSQHERGRDRDTTRQSTTRPMNSPG